MQSTLELSFKLSLKTNVNLSINLKLDFRIYVMLWFKSLSERHIRILLTVSRYSAVHTRVDNKHNCKDEIRRVWITLNYIHKSQYGQYDAKSDVENGHNKKCPFPQI